MLKTTTTIIDGKIVTYNEGCPDDEHFFQLSGEEQAKCIKWVRENLRRVNSYTCYSSSYGLKHYLERDIHIYTTNNQFKELMLICGYTPKRFRELNWDLNVSRNSPAFHKGLMPI